MLSSASMNGCSEEIIGFSIDYYFLSNNNIYCDSCSKS